MDAVLPAAKQHVSVGGSLQTASLGLRKPPDFLLHFYLDTSTAGFTMSDVPFLHR
jgi:hypothetical protein